MSHEFTDLDVVKADIRLLQQQSVGLERAVAEMRKDFHDQSKDLAILTRILRGENGTDSLLIRFALAERIVTESAASMQQLKTTMESKLNEDTKGRWSLAQAVVVAVIGVLGVLAGALLTGK